MTEVARDLMPKRPTDPAARRAHDNAVRRRRYRQDRDRRRALKRADYVKRGDVIRARQRRFYSANKDRVKARAKRHRETHKAEISARQKRWYRQNREKKLAYDRQRRRSPIAQKALAAARRLLANAARAGQIRTHRLPMGERA